MQNEIEWSQHTLDVAFFRSLKFGSGFVKVQVSDAQIWLFWMTESRFNKTEKEYSIGLVSVAYMEICSVNNEEHCVPLKSFCSKRLTIFQDKCKWGKFLHFKLNLLQLYCM